MGQNGEQGTVGKTLHKEQRQGSGTCNSLQHRPANPSGLAHFDVKIHQAIQTCTELLHCELLAHKGRVTVVDTLEYFSVGKGSMTDLVHKAEDATEVSTDVTRFFCPTLGHLGKNSLREVVV